MTALKSALSIGSRVCICHPGRKWHLKNICFILIIFFNTFTTTAQTLDSSQLPAVWLRADTGLVSPTLWNDFSGNKRAATTTLNEAPAKNALFNYNSALTFDGLNDRLTIPFSLEELREITVMAVFQTADTSERGIWGAENALSRNSFLTTRLAAGPDSAIDYYGKNEQFAVLSTVLQSWDPAITTSPTAFLTLGNAGKGKNYTPFKGKLAELLVFDNRLDAITRLQWETYLAIKYGIPVVNGNYVGINEEVLWNAEDNKDFAFRVTGIGKDSTFYLNQKQSKSSFDDKNLLVISANKWTETNAQNSALINQGDYLIWGDNNDTLLTANPPDETLALLKRKWLMNVSGKTATELPTQVRINLKELPANERGYWLAIDQTGKGIFNTDHLLYILADSTTKDSVTIFNNVKWDSDRSGQDAFGLAQSKGIYALLAVDTPTCKEPLSGKALIKVLAGKAPFQYELSNTASGSYLKGTHAKHEDTLRLSGLSIGDYILRIKDASGEEVTRRFKFSYPNTLLVNLGPDRELTPTTNLEIDATKLIPVTTPATYQWSSSYGYSSTDGKINVTESGIYRVQVTNAEGCVFTDEVVVKGAKQQRAEVFPSFTPDGKFNVSVSLTEAGKVTVGIYDLKGNKVGEMRGENNAEFHFYGQVTQPGVYMVVIHTAKGTETKKIIAIK